MFISLHCFIYAATKNWESVPCGNGILLREWHLPWLFLITQDDPPVTQPHLQSLPPPPHTSLLLCQNIVVKAIYIRKLFLSWKLSWVDGVLSFLFYLVFQWQKTPRFSFKWQTWQLEQEAGSTHLQPQACSRESELKATQGYKLSKPTSSDILPSARWHRLSFPNSATWRPSVQIPEPMGDILTETKASSRATHPMLENTWRMLYSYRGKRETVKMSQLFFIYIHKE